MTPIIKKGIQKDVERLGRIKKSQAEMIENSRATINRLDAEILEKDDELYDIQRDIADSRQQAEESRNALRNLENRIKEGNELVSVNSQKLAEQKAEAEEASEELKSVEQDLSIKKKLRDSARSDYQFYQERVESKQSELDNLNIQKSDLDGEIGKLCDRKEQVRQELEKDEGSTRGLDDRQQEMTEWRDGCILGSID